MDIEDDLVEERVPERRPIVRRVRIAEKIQTKEEGKGGGRGNIKSCNDESPICVWCIVGLKREREMKGFPGLYRVRGGL